MKKRHSSRKEVVNGLIMLAVLSIALAALEFRDFGTFFLFLSGFWFGLWFER